MVFVAPVAQWIEQSRPKGKIRVRFLAGAQVHKKAAILLSVDPELKELKELVRRNIALSEDTNRAVHRMRRSVVWGRLFQLVWWVAIFALSGYAYYYYLQPYVVKLEQLYEQVQKGGQQAQSAMQQLQQEEQKLT